MKKFIEHLVFKIGKEVYAFNLEHVETIRDGKEEYIRPIPNTSYDVLGAMSYKKDVIPIYDLRKKLDIASDKIDEIPYIIISNIEDNKGGSYTVGWVVDITLDVIKIEENNDEKKNKKKINSDFFGKSTEYISYVYRMDKEQKEEDKNMQESHEEKKSIDCDLIIILNAKKLLGVDEIKDLLEKL